MFNENWYSEGAIVQLGKLLERVKCTGSYIEVGCWEGKSSSAIANFVHPHELNCVDTFMGNVGEGADHPTIQILAERNVKQVFMDNMNQLTKGNFILHHMDGDEYLKQVKEPIAFFHLDADHSFKAVKATLEIVLPKLASGALICGDDFTYPDVNRAVLEAIPGVSNDGVFWYSFKD